MQTQELRKAENATSLIEWPRLNSAIIGVGLVITMYRRRADRIKVDVNHFKYDYNGPSSLTKRVAAMQSGLFEFVGVGRLIFTQISP